MSAARRAAIYLALRSEPALEASANDTRALDEYCAIGALVERGDISDATLAAASADPCESVAVLARVMLAARTTLRGIEALECGGRQTVDHEGRPLQRSTSDATIASIFAQARELGIRSLEVPRDVLRALGGCFDPPLALLRAAFSNDDDALIRAMSIEFDVAELRMAQRLSAGRPLRKGLATAGAAFRGGEARERALLWSDRVRAVRNAGRKKRGALRAAVETAGCDDATLLEEARDADAVWESVTKAPPVTVRANVFCDGLERGSIGELVLAPIGSPPSLDAPVLRFDEPMTDGVRGAFLHAIELEPASGNAFHIGQPLHRALALWFERSSTGGRHTIDAPGLSPYVWPRPDHAQPVVAPAMTFSASRLNLYAKCARRWFYEYLCGAVEERSTSNAAYGKVFHAALESLHREVRVPSQWTPAEVSGKLLTALDAAFGQAHGEFASQLEYEVLRLRARRVAQHYVRWLYEEAADAPLEIVEIESRQQLLLGGHRFVGFIDRIDRPATGGPITIFDYKTGRIEDDPESYLRQVRDGEEAQLALYYAMRRAQGDRIARIALVSIRDSRDKTWVLALDIAGEDGAHVVPRADRAGVVRASCTPGDLERSLAVLMKRCDLLTQEGVAHFEVGDDPPCSYCAYANACRERPADGERIFAR